MCWQEDQESWPPSTPVQTRRWESVTAQHCGSEAVAQLGLPSHKHHRKNTTTQQSYQMALLFRSIYTQEAHVTYPVGFFLKFSLGKNQHLSLTLIFVTKCESLAHLAGLGMKTKGSTEDWGGEARLCARTGPLRLLEEAAWKTTMRAHPPQTPKSLSGWPVSSIGDLTILSVTTGLSVALWHTTESSTHNWLS